MLNIKGKRRTIEMAVVFGLICAILLSMAHFDAVCDDLRNNILRLHIFANSDSKEDQEVKLKVRDAVIKCAQNIFSDSKNLNQAEETAKNNIEIFSRVASQTLYENGYEYSATAKIGDSNFETREYEEFTLPAGTYRSLIITLGEGKGENWWCVVFPSVCLTAAGEHSLNETASPESTKTAENPKKYIVRFKTVEIYEEIKRIFKKR